MGRVTMQRIGVLGGTFDPPHYGHLAIAETARAQLRLERVLFVPAGAPPHRPTPLSAPHHRAAMVEEAIIDNPAFALSRVDLDRAGPHYTETMLSLLQTEYPQAILFLIIGSDNLAQFLTWRNPAHIIRQARLAVMERPGWRPNLEQLEQALPAIRQRLIWLVGPPLEISSSALRERVRRGLPLRYLVPPLVEGYIIRHKLYRSMETQDE